MDKSQVAAALRAALLRVNPALADQPVKLDCETAWAVVEQPMNLRGRINWSGSPLGRLLRERLAEAQNHRCCLCGTTMMSSDPLVPLFGDYLRMLTLEHAVPLCDGGADHPDNLVVSCLRCNSTRHAPHGERHDRQARLDGNKGSRRVSARRLVPARHCAAVSA
jgi:hypothetical protein